MAFRLRHRRSFAKDLERLLDAEFRTALKSVTEPAPDEKAIHEARKSVKKIRAVLRLLQQPLGSSYGAENRRLRDAAHCLAPIRDVDATIETVRQLRSRYTHVMTPAIVRALTHGLRGQQRRVQARAARLVAPAIRHLQKSKTSAPDRIRRVGKFTAVLSGMTRGYRRARKAMEKLSIDSDATQFHAWRRRVKDHAYHVQLFAGFHATPRGRARSLKKLETLLGDDHNLAMLRSTILDAPDTFGSARVTLLVLGCIVKAQAWLRPRMLKAGRRLFGHDPSEFRRSVTEWSTARERP